MNNLMVFEESKMGYHKHIEEVQMEFTSTKTTDLAAIRELKNNTKQKKLCLKVKCDISFLKFPALIINL